MIPASTLDAAMLLAETAEMPLHTLGILILSEPLGSADEAYARMRRSFAARLSLVPPFRRRIVADPLGIGDLHWIDDPSFDLDRHLMRRTLPSPGGRAELDALVSAYAEALLAREKPLWEVLFVDGLESGELALVVKIHHATMDGAGVVALLDRLFDRSAEPAEGPSVADAFRPEREPSALGLAAITARTLAAKPREVARATRKVADVVLRSSASRARAPASHASSRSGAFDVPRTPWNGALSPRRSIDFADVALEDLRTVRARFGTTLNDVVLAAAAGTLRRWLLARHALPDRPLVANVPIAVRGVGPDDRAGNQISMMRVHLPVGEADPVARLLRIHEETAARKKTAAASGAKVFELLTDVVLHATVPALLTRAVGFYARHRGADFHPAPWNLVISNLPGPAHDLYCGGSKVLRIYPYGPVQHGSGLNLTVLSSGDRLCLGALACRDRVPELASVVDGFVTEVDALLRRAKASA